VVFTNIYQTHSGLVTIWKKN